MTIQQIYNLAIKMGIEADPRGKSAVLKQLKREKEDFQDLSKDLKEEFDKEKFVNPFPDSRFHFGNASKIVKRVLVGIDIDGSELLLADKFNQKGKNIDLVIAHHPLGRALAGLDEQVGMQTEILADMGVPVHLVETHFEERMEELTRSLNPINHYQVIDFARLLNIALMNIHTITDNLVNEFINDYFKKSKPETLADIIKLLKKIPEYKTASINGHGPIITSGKPTRKCGKIFFDLTGGTNGSKNIYDGISRAGFNTIVGMHMTDIYKEEVQKHHLNIIIAGHISSDSLGMNLFLDQLEQKGIEVIPISGLIRVKRTN